MSNNAPLTAEEIKQFAIDWYKALDVHMPMVDVLAMLPSDGFTEMIFPEIHVKQLADFETWYQNVIRVFFDEVHTVKSVDSDINGTQAEVKVLVKWEASRWNPPAPQSERLIMDAYQTWRVKRDETTGKVVITFYGVDKIEALPGSVEL